MNITKATRWRVFAGVWLQSLFTSTTAYFSLFCIPLTTKFGWSDSAFALAYTIYMFTYCAVGFIGGSLAEKISPRKIHLHWSLPFCRRLVLNRFCIQHPTAVCILRINGWCRRRYDLPGMSSYSIKMVP